jgi:hypothetical protein
VISKVVFTTSWDLLTSEVNRGVTTTLETIIQLVGVMHQSPLLYTSKHNALIFPNLAWSPSSLRTYTKAVITASMKVRANDPGVDDYFGQFSSAKDPETGEPALNGTDLRLNSSNFIIAGKTASSLGKNGVNGVFLLHTY